MRLLLASAIGAAVLCGAYSVAPAHEGHDHGPSPAPAADTALPRGEASSESYELVAVADGGELVIYLDRFASNEPVDGAQIEVETPDGPQNATAHTGQPYRLSASWLAKPGKYDLVFTVSADGDLDVLPLSIDTSVRDGTSGAPNGIPSAFSNPPGGSLFALAGALLAGVVLGGLMMARRRGASAALVLLCTLTLNAFTPGTTARAHDGDDHGTPKAAPASGELARRLPDGSVFVPKPVQRIFGVRTILTATDAWARSVELPGRVIPDPNASGYVQAAIGGRLSPPPGGFPRLGTAVKQGDVLAYVTPPLQAIDISTMRQQQGDLDQQISIVERRLVRFEALAPSGAVARSQLDETRLELQGLKERRASLDAVRREPEALIAPVSGVIADGSPIAGQIAQPNAVIYHIVDPARLWIEALSFEAHGGEADASALTASGQSLKLKHRGAGFADRSQAVPIHYAIDGGLAGVRIGQFVTVTVATQTRREGIAVPRGSVVRGVNGQHFVFEHVSAERFLARPVRIEPLDAAQVLVVAGIDKARRVVAQGADLLDHVR